MTNAKMNGIWLNAKMALSTVNMLSDMFEMEFDDETGELCLGQARLEMYSNVLASIYGQIKQIADALDKA